MVPTGLHPINAILIISQVKMEINIDAFPFDSHAIIHNRRYET